MLIKVYQSELWEKGIVMIRKLQKVDINKVADIG